MTERICSDFPANYWEAIEADVQPKPPIDPGSDDLTIQQIATLNPVTPDQIAATGRWMAEEMRRIRGF